jgi:hypothetical protein
MFLGQEKDIFVGKYIMKIKRKLSFEWPQCYEYLCVRSNFKNHVVVVDLVVIAKFHVPCNASALIGQILGGICFSWYSICILLIFCASLRSA